MAGFRGVQFSDVILHVKISNEINEICKDRIGTVGLAPLRDRLMARPNRGLSSAGSAFEVWVGKSFAMKFAKIV